VIPVATALYFLAARMINALQNREPAYDKEFVGVCTLANRNAASQDGQWVHRWSKS
jgi:hypothetical protein